MTIHRISTMRQVLRDAAHGRLEEAWIYLQDEAEIRPESPCLVMAYDEDEEESEDEDEDKDLESARTLGFPQEGLDTPALENCATWAKLHESEPSDELLLYAFRYYWRFDNFPEHPWDSDPLTGEEATRFLALEFYRSLGPERADVPCQRQGCNGGAIHQSLLCRRHHYEMLYEEPCPAVHYISTLREVLRQAAQNDLDDVWIYLKDEADIRLESECLVLPEGEEEDAPMRYAGDHGFPLEGLNTALIENCAAWAALHEAPPSDKLLLYAFRYYWRFERFPEQPWTPYPPADQEVPISRAPDPDWKPEFEDPDLEEDAEVDPYGELLDRSYEELQFQTETSERLFQMSSASFNVDLKVGRIVFRSPQGIKASADIQVIGTFSKIKGNWLWAWANPTIPASLCGFANAAKNYGAEQGIEDYTTPMFDCGEDDGWEFTAVANQLGGGQGAYRAPDGDRLMYLCFGPLTIERV